MTSSWIAWIACRGFGFSYEVTVVSIFFIKKKGSPLFSFSFLLIFFLCFFVCFFLFLTVFLLAAS
jgi:hypothetical protein